MNSKLTILKKKALVVKIRIDIFSTVTIHILFHVFLQEAQSKWDYLNCCGAA